MKILCKMLACAVLLLTGFCAQAKSCDALLSAMKRNSLTASIKGSPASELEYAALSGNVDDIRHAASKIGLSVHDEHSQLVFQTELNKAIYWAAMAGETHSISVLATLGASIESPIGTSISGPLVGAAECGQIDSMAELVKLGADVSARTAGVTQVNVPATALEAAIGGGQVAAVRWLLSHGVDTCSKTAKNRLIRMLESPSIRNTFSTSELRILECK